MCDHLLHRSTGRWPGESEPKVSTECSLRQTYGNAEEDKTVRSESQSSQRYLSWQIISGGEMKHTIVLIIVCAFVCGCKDSREAANGTAREDQTAQGAFRRPLQEIEHLRQICLLANECQEGSLTAAAYRKNVNVKLSGVSSREIGAIANCLRAFAFPGYAEERDEQELLEMAWETCIGVLADRTDSEAEMALISMKQAADGGASLILGSAIENQQRLMQRNHGGKAGNSP